MRSLTPKQAKFCIEYIVDLNATQAAIRAGYSPRSARAVGAKNMTKHDIAGRLAELTEAAIDETKATADEVLLYFTGIMRDTKQPTKERTAAATQLAKYHNLLTDRKEIKHSGRVEHWQQLDDIREFKAD